MKINIRISLLFFISLICIQCNRTSIINDTKAIESIHFIRFDEDLKEFDVKNIAQSEKKILTKHPEMFPFYIQKLMGLGVVSPVNSKDYYGNYIGQFLQGEYKAMMDTCQHIIFNKIPSIEQDITKAYSHLLYYYPSKKSPKIYTFFISPFGSNAMAAFSYGSDTIGINWFHYLGKDFSLYPNVYEGYKYMIEWNQMDYMPRNIMLVEYNNLVQNETYDELIYNMVNEGKKYYFLDKIIPDTKDCIKIGYTESQLKWCSANEVEIWAYFKEHKLLYSKDPMDIKRYTQEGPSTPGMPQESPGMIGSWIGWQIVKKYAEKHSNVPLDKILEVNAKNILKEIDYKPKK